MILLNLDESEYAKSLSEGFFKLIEGAMIELASHANEADWMLQEMIDFDNVIGDVLEFA